MSNKHPFLNQPFQIRWSELSPEAIEPDITLAIEQATKKLDAIGSLPSEALTFENTLLAFEDALETVGVPWGLVSHLDSVNNNPALREVHNAMLPKISSFFTRVYLRDDLWQTLRRYAETPEAQSLTGTRRRFLEETLKDFRESGADLSPEKKRELEEINAELSKLTQKYSENVLDSTNDWELIVEDESELAGLPTSARDVARQDARRKGIGSDTEPRWRFTLHAPSLLPILKYAESEALRKRVWEASNQIGWKNGFDNTTLIREILNLRQRKATLLGHRNFADLVTARRMAGSGDRALHFIEDLHAKVRTPFLRELEALEAFKAQETHTSPDRLEPWETTYWAEKQRRLRYDLDEEELRPYFPINQVIDGLFRLCERLFDIHISEQPDGSVETWHPEVHFYNIYDRNGTHLGSFYTDWFPRESKRSGAWMNHLLTGGPQPDGTFAPHLGLMCGNFTPPLEGQPALLTHQEVSTVFHEFGHLLHHLLSRVEIKSLSGTNVAWDFVELPSQIMENWCWEREALDLFARHYQTGEPIPEALFQKMVAARNYMEASATMRQLSFAKMDLELHLHFALQPADDLDAYLRDKLRDYQAPLKTKPPTIVRRFTHLFSSPTAYAAGYYSYKWAEVLDADCFTRFKKEGILNPQTGRAFRDAILARGNSAPPEQLFREFMGRDPDPTALLRRAGLA